MSLKYEPASEQVRALSMEEEGLKIPQHGWGIWPKAARKPVPFRKEEAKVFLLPPRSYQWLLSAGRLIKADNTDMLSPPS